MRDGANSGASVVAGGLLRVEKIYHEPKVGAYARGREILGRFPAAERVEVPSHWNIPELHGDAGVVGDWARNKKTVLVLGVKKGLGIRSFYRSADFIAPSQANGCAMACSYCVAAGTLVTTPEGRVPVEQIRDGDRVLAYDSSSERLVEARASRTASREVDEVLEIRVGGRVLRVTEHHPLMTRRGWVRAGDLTTDDEVLCDEGRRG
ncbi:MAG: Hint domain-containing protein [Rubrobacter sp.]